MITIGKWSPLGRRIAVFVGVMLAAFAALTLALVVSGLRDDIARSDVALVLGSKVELDGTPSPRLRARLDKAAELFHAGTFPQIIVSGGVGKEGFDEAAVMRDYLMSHGVPTDRIIVDSLGVTTFASAKNAAQISQQLGLKSVLVVSQYFHIPRSRLALKHFLIPAVHSAHAEFFEWRDVYSSLRETMGYAAYLLRGSG